MGIPFSRVSFGTSEAGKNELAGWWLPAEKGASLAGVTVLYLHDGTGSLPDTLPGLARLHALGCAVFAFDYRGYGASLPAKPSEAGMVEDAGQAVSYLLDSRHIAPGSLVLWGRGMGATIAAESAERAESGRDPAHSLPLLLEDINPPAIELLRNDPRTHLLPLRLLLRDHLDATHAFQTSRARKLFLGSAPSTESFYRVAAEPKQLGRENQNPLIATFLAKSSPK